MFVKIFLFFLALVIALPCQQLNPTLDTKIQKGTYQIFAQNYSKATKIFDELIRQFPEHPAGYFYKAVTLDMKMSYYGSMKYESEFYSLCDIAIDKCQKALKTKSKDPWMYFFWGGASGYKGNYEARHYRYVSAFRYGWRGYSKLEKARKLNSAIIDIDFGLGLYNYWKSKMMQKFKMWWLPGGEDRSAEGIKQLLNAVANGKYTKTAASEALLWVYLEEGRNKDVVSLSGRLMKIHKNNQQVKWARGLALYKLGKYDEAEDIFRYILDVNDARPYNTQVNSLKMRVSLARIYMAKKLYYKAIAECRRAKYYRIASLYKDDVKEDLKAAQDILKEARKSR